MLLEKRFPSPVILTGESYDANRKYVVGEVIRYTISGQSGGWILLVDAPAGTAPRANSAYWAPYPGTFNEVMGPQGLPAPKAQVEYSATDTPSYTWRTNYVDNDEFRRVSYDEGTTWVIERIRGAVGPKGDTPVFRQPADGENAPLVTWQYAAQPSDENSPLEWRDTYVQGDVWKHYSNNGGKTYGVPERILARDGRDGFDLERQYSNSETGPWEVHDTGQAWVRERVGNIEPFGPPFLRTEAETSGTEPVSNEVLWATSNELPRNNAASSNPITSWTVTEDAPDGVEDANDGVLAIPGTLRGTLYIEVYEGDVLRGKQHIPIDAGTTPLDYRGSTTAFSVLVNIDTGTNPTFRINVFVGSSTVSVPADTRIRVYALSAGGGGGISRPTAEAIARAAAMMRYSDEEKAEVAKIADIVERLNNLAPEVNFAVLNWRGGKPRPPFKSQVEAFQKGLLTIGIDLDGVLWTLKDTPGVNAKGDWVDFVRTQLDWDGEFNTRLPDSALQTGDFYYRYDEDVWVLFDGTKQIVYHDRDISAFLPNHIFLGQFPNAQAATESIVGYDGTKTYLAYFTVTVSGRTGREVQQLQSYTPGTAEGISWVSTNETLNHVSAELHKLIQANVDAIAVERSIIAELAKRIESLANGQSDQGTAIAENKSAIDNIESPDKVSDRDALSGTSREGYLSSRQVRLNVLAAYVKEVSDDPELDTINRRYAVIDHVAAAYNADNLEFGQMMFDNANLASVTKVKIGYVDEGKPSGLFSGLRAGDKLELWAINAPHDYEEPFNAYESQITGVVNTQRPAINAISTIELTVSTAPPLTLGFGPNTSYILAVSGKFKGRLARRLVVRDWDETRDNTAIVLPANYRDFAEIDIVVRGQGNTEYPLRYPTDALADPRRDSTTPSISQLGNNRNNMISFNRITRTITSAGDRVNGFTYVELWT